MTKYNTYTTVTPATGDKLLGTDISDTSPDVNGESVNFTISGIEAILDVLNMVNAPAEALADVTDATSVAAAGAVMEDGSGDMTGDLIFSEKADHTATPSAGKGQLWVKNTIPATLVFTDDAGTDFVLGTATDGDKGDITVASGVWTIDADAVTLAKIAAAAKSGADATLITGTAGTSGNILQWNADGDAVDSSVASANILTSSGAVDVSAYVGVLGLNSGTPVDVSTKALLEARLSDVADIAEADGDVWTGVHDFGGATSLEVPNSATPTVNADGEVAIDTAVTDFSHGVMKYYGGEEMGVLAMPIAEFTTPTNAAVPTYNATSDEFEMVVPSGSGDMLIATYDAAAISQQVVGLTATQTLTNKTLTAPIISSVSNTGTVTFPTATTTLVGIGTTDTLTNKDISNANNTYRAASTTVVGAAEVATAGETGTGTDATRMVSPDGLAGSTYGKEVITVCLFDDSEDVATGDGAGDQLLRIPSKLNGWNLIEVAAYHQTAGTGTGVQTTDVQIANVTDVVDMLSTKLTVDEDETDSSTAATAAVIDATNDDVATGDKLRFDVDAVTGTTAAKGLWVELTFQLP